MRVTAWNNGGSTYGIRVGTKNRREFFDEDWDQAEVEIEGEVYRIPITDGFWNECPELRSPAIRDWLERTGRVPWPKGHPPRMKLLPLGGNRFRLVS